MLLVNAQNCLEVSNEECSQSRCPILVCLTTLARKKALCDAVWAALMLLALSSPHAQNLDSVSSNSKISASSNWSSGTLHTTKKNVAPRGLL